VKLREVEVEKVLVPSDRVRKKFDKRKLRNLAMSFQKMGQLQPGVCIEGAEGKFILIAGERRLRACELASLPFIFVLKDEADPLLLKEIEIEENVCRENLTWLEEVVAVEQLHELRQEQKYRTTGEKQTLVDTAEEVEVSKSQLQRDLEMAEWAKEFKEVADAKSKTEAAKIIKRLKGVVIRERMLETATETATESVARKEEAPEKAEDAPTKVEIAGRKIENEYLLELDRRIIHGRMEEKLEDFKDESVQVVTFDPFWGVNYDEVSRTGGGTTPVNDDPAVVFANLESWLQIIYKKMAEASHLYLFFGIVYHAAIYELLEKRYK